MKQKSQSLLAFKADQHIKTITLELALKLFDYPKFIGTHEGKELTIKVGRFGPYIQFGIENISIPKEIEPEKYNLRKGNTY